MLASDKGIYFIIIFYGLCFLITKIIQMGRDILSNKTPYFLFNERIFNAHIKPFIISSDVNIMHTF